MSETRITPDPTDEETAAIVAALSALGDGSARPPADADSVSRWRWSGRWWTKPVPLGRDRPW